MAKFGKGLPSLNPLFIMVPTPYCAFDRVAYLEDRSYGPSRPSGPLSSRARTVNFVPGGPRPALHSVYGDFLVDVILLLYWGAIAPRTPHPPLPRAYPTVISLLFLFLMFSINEISNDLWVPRNPLPIIFNGKSI